MTRPTYRTGELIADGFADEWAAHNSVDGSFVPKPEFVYVESPGVGVSTRSLPSDKRTTPYVYVYDHEGIQPDWADVNWNSQDYGATVRLEVIVASDMHGRAGDRMRDDIIQVFENIREEQSAPKDGVFGSDWQSLQVGNIDTTPTEFSNQWRAFYDVILDSQSVI